MNNWNRNILKVLNNCFDQSFEEYIKECLQNHSDGNEIFSKDDSSLLVCLCVKSFSCPKNPGKIDSEFLFSIEDTENSDKKISWVFGRDDNESFIENYKNIDIQHNIIYHLKHIYESGCVYLCDECDGLTDQRDICSDCFEEGVGLGGEIG
jgi:hypothetical protein